MSSSVARKDPAAPASVKAAKPAKAATATPTAPRTPKPSKTAPVAPPPPAPATDRPSTVLDARIPEGPLEKKWEKHKFDSKLINPANRRKYEIIIVGS